MQSIYFTPEHELYRKQLLAFLDSEVLPYADTWEKNRRIPRSAWHAMGKFGLFGLHYPQELGGAAKEIFYSVILLEELGRTGYAGLRVAVGVHAYMATPYFMLAGSDYLKKEYLMPAILGQKIASLAITEPGAGSDLNALQTTAILDGDSYILNGTKKFVANGTTSDFIIVAAVQDNNSEMQRRASAISLLVVDTNLLGVQRTQLDTLNWHASDTSIITFDNVRVPKSNLIGEPKHGFTYLMKCLQFERLVAGLLAIGGIDSCLDITWRYISKRKISNLAISKFQAVRHRLADLVSELEAVRQLAYHVAWMYAQGHLAIAECSMLKLRATELANTAARECLQLHGAYGCEADNAISRLYRDAAAATVAGGASEIMRDIVAQITFDESGWRRKEYS